MRLPSIGTGLLSAAMFVAAVMPVQSAAAEQPYCPNVGHRSPGKVPGDLMAPCSPPLWTRCPSILG
jgi:hypothetical protein